MGVASVLLSWPICWLSLAGWSPTLNLTCHLGGRPVWDDAKTAFLPGQLPPGMRVAGAVAGAFGLHACLESGARAGQEAADDAGFPGQRPVLPPADDEPDGGSGRCSTCLAAAARPLSISQHDVTADDIALAAREGFRSVEHTKRYTTLGMATDQGKTSNLVGLAILANATGRDIAQTGTTMFRPPYTPVAIGAVAGAHTGAAIRPRRLAPTHDWSAAHGGSFVESGAWLRAQWYARPWRGWLA